MLEAQRLRRNGDGLQIQHFRQAQARRHVLIGGEAPSIRARAIEFLGLPGRAAVEAAGLHVDYGLAFVDGVTAWDGLVPANGEADDDFIAPMPHAVVGGPTAEAPWLAEYGGLAHGLGLQVAHHLADFTQVIGAMRDDAEHGRQLVDALPIVRAIEMPADALIG